jgi:hypothetical protein
MQLRSRRRVVVDSAFLCPRQNSRDRARATNAHIADMTMEEALDDLAARFIINLPKEEFQSFERLCFQIEQAHWFYIDHMRPAHPNLSSVALKSFTKARMCSRSMLLACAQSIVSFRPMRAAATARQTARFDTGKVC